MITAEKVLTRFLRVLQQEERPLFTDADEGREDGAVLSAMGIKRSVI